MGNQEIVQDALSAAFGRTKTSGEFCECYEYDTIEEEVENMDILFLGHATGPATSIGTDDDGAEWFATPFVVSETLKGRMPKKVKLVHELSDGSNCGTDFPVNETILWCAYRGKLTAEDEIDTTYYTDGCAHPQYTIEEYRRVLG